MAIYSGFTHQKWVITHSYVNVYQRVRSQVELVRWQGQVAHLESFQSFTWGSQRALERPAASVGSVFSPNEMEVLMGKP